MLASLRFANYVLAMSKLELTDSKNETGLRVSIRTLERVRSAKAVMRRETGRFHSADAVVSEAMTLLERKVAK